VEVTYDPAKNNRNIRERRLPFGRAANFDFATAVIDIDRRRDYGEIRVVALGYLDCRLHVLCYVETEIGIRVISLRKANARETRRYANTKAAD
jgi:uncharacterized DUF497 family protein